MSRKKATDEDSSVDQVEIESLARLIRKIARVDDRSIVNVDELLHRFRTILPHLRVRVVSDVALPPKVDAQAFPRRSLVKIRRGIKDGLLRGDGGARWTVAHEVGHVLMQHPRSPYRTMDDNTRKTRDRIPEREANIFAAELLSPKHLARRYKTIEELRSAFQISVAAAKVRLKESREEELRSASTLPQVRQAVEKLRARGRYLSALEDDAAIAFSTIADTIARCNEGTDLTVQPLNSNLLGTSILIAVAARLLLDAYESFKRTTPSQKYRGAATLAAAILFIRPIRGNETTPEISKRVQVLNQQAALRAAASLMKVSLQDIDGIYLRGVDHVGVLSYRSDYLTHLVDLSRDLISSASKIPFFGKFPIYEAYNAKNDFSTWEEIHSLEGIMDIMFLLDATRSPKP